MIFVVNTQAGSWLGIHLANNSETPSFCRLPAGHLTSFPNLANDIAGGNLPICLECLEGARISDAFETMIKSKVPITTNGRLLIQLARDLQRVLDGLGPSASPRSSQFLDELKASLSMPEEEP